ncbi:DUF1565 domain-containing protein [Sanguibacter antarcticus]|uniref:Parallel beta helix pectate lyase-like protein n=1 Tax=Sanguibacter antarcticus TaxID=372484 RepID=A0A2A9E0J3_9MICO|nr:right-handed parallel beta-helix repeat-containing protein [Sanguibacter antarcticus]PFG32354.1 parallel beta helix pectate lyase-like protein [Sanguibacter antarcticus]
MNLTRTSLRTASLLFALVVALPATSAVAGTRGNSDLYVSPAGNEANTGTRHSPLASIQQAVDLAQPGSTVHLAPGTYLQDVVSAAPDVRIVGPSSAVVQGTGESRAIVEIHHDGVELSGFTIDGLIGDPDQKEGYRKKLLYVISTTAGDGVDDLSVKNMTIRNAGEECVRLRYLITGAEIAYNTINDCGTWDFRFADGGKVGEGIYLGTAPEQQGLNGAPDAQADVSRDNWIHHNVIATQGNECVDIKENSTANLVERNDCSGQQDPNSAGLDARGSGNTFRANYTHDNVGAGIRVGGDLATDGTANNIYGNVIRSNAAGGIKFEATPQGRVCGNSMADNTGGDAVGTYSAEYDPTSKCR